ncbi:MAG: non-reducing end alpha-L-arabinofuranosidase family hydrolase [Rubripirellula sp.]
MPEQWEYSAPLISPEIREQEPSHAQKDPTILFHEGHWHVFMTVKLPNRSAIEHCSFTDWSQADQAERTLLEVSESDYFCAPQVFYFRPHKKWYLVYQASMPTGQKPRKMWVAYSTTTDLSDPGSWSKAKPMLDGGPDDPRQLGGLDYWIICDDAHAYLFLTSLNGKMWRMRTPLNDFPYGFNDWQLALSDKIFEASHTYRIQGSTQYVTLIEQKGRRFFKAFLADRLDGPWRPIADTREKPFAGLHNIRPAKHVSVWTDNVSHGELVRASNDETLAIDPNDLRFVFQGMLESEKRDLGDKYGKYPWRIGILTPHPKTKSDL